MKKERRSYQQWLEQIYLLTKKRRLRDLNIQLGKPTAEACTASYEPSDLDELKQLAISSNHGLEVYYEALDHFLRTKAEPFQAMLTTWMSGAKAYVRDSVIPFNDAINWCQNASDPDDRKTLAKELKREIWECSRNETRNLYRKQRNPNRGPPPREQNHRPNLSLQPLQVGGKGSGFRNARRPERTSRYGRRGPRGDT